MHCIWHLFTNYPMWIFYIQQCEGRDNLKICLLRNTQKPLIKFNKYFILYNEHRQS